MTVKTGYASTKSVNGETVPDFTTEKAGSSTIAKMMKATTELLTRSKVKGVGGAIGTYDDDVIGEAVHRIFNGAHVVDVYGTSIQSDYYQRLKLI